MRDAIELINYIKSELSRGANPSSISKSLGIKLDIILIIIKYINKVRFFKNSRNFSCDIKQKKELIVSADYHVGSKFQSSHNLKEFFDFVSKRNVGLSLIAGDLTDCSHNKNHGINFSNPNDVAAFISDYLPQKSGLIHYAIPGNHDNIFLLNYKIDIIQKIIERGRNDIINLGPIITDEMYADLEIIRTYFASKGFSQLGYALAMIFLNKYFAILELKGLKIIMQHKIFVGGNASKEKYARYLDGLPKSVKKCDMLVSGHVHKPFNCKFDSGPTVIQSSSLTTGDDEGFYDVSMSTNSRGEVNNIIPTFIKCDKSPVRRVRRKK